MLPISTIPTPVLLPPASGTIKSPQPQPPLDGLKFTPDTNDVPFRGSATSCPVELAKMWSIFEIDLESPISLRAISPKGAPSKLDAQNFTFNPADFPVLEDRKQAFSARAIALNNQGYNVYFVMNPIDPGFPGDLCNGFAVADADIATRRLLLIDLDRTGHLVASATNDEIDDSTAVADRLATFLNQKYDIEVARTMSGNGIHLYVPLPDMPNDGKTKVECQRLLDGFGRRFDTATIKVDRGVFNASRITKVPGTVARKGIETSERPFRMAFVK